MEDLYPFSEFSFEAVVEDKYSSSNNNFWNSSSDPLDQHHHHNEDEVVKNVKISEAEDCGDSGGLDSLCSINNFGFFSDHYYSSQEDCLFSFTNQQKDQSLNLDYGSLDNLRFDMVISSPHGDTPKFDDQIPVMADLSLSNNKNYRQNENLSLPLASLDLLNNYGNGLKLLYGETEPDDDHHQLQRIDDLRGRKKLSTEDVMKIAATMFIRSSSSDQSGGLDSLIPHPYDYYYYYLSEEEKEDVKLAESLLASAEKVSLRQFERAARLLDHCDSQSSKTGNAVKRVLSYFCEALRERLNRATGRACAPPFFPEGEIPRHYHKYRKNEFALFDPDKSMQNPSPTMIACHLNLPFCQVAKFAGIQAMLEKLSNSKKIHIIDLGIKTGTQWAILMQAVTLRRELPLEVLKITAVGTTEKDSLEKMGKRLTSFAKSMNIPFSFKIVTVSDMHELKEELFELDGEETIAVYALFALRPLLAESDQLEAMMKVIRNLNPIVMVVTEVEANHNSKSFVTRFTEALFYFSAVFDCVEVSMERDDPNRRVLESLYLRYGIRDIVAAEGEKRKIRNVKIEVWRAFFERFGMLEEELSMSSLYQAELVAKTFAAGGFCTFHMNGRSLLSGWKGTPLYSLSAWRFL